MSAKVEAPMNQVIKVDIQLDAKNRARLQSKKYHQDFTDIPNKAIPAKIKEGLANVYQNLTGTELPDDDSTFTVRAENFLFKRLLTPTVFRYPSTDGSFYLGIKWGSKVIPLSLEGGKITCPTSPNKKIKLKFVSEPFGKYYKTCIAVSYSDKGNLYSMTFPLRSTTLTDDLNMEEVEFLLEENPQGLMERIAEAKVGSDEDYQSSGKRLEGEYFVKVSNLPLGDYTVTGFKKYVNDYGDQHVLEVEAVSKEGFTSTVRVKGEGDQWGDQEVLVTGKFLVKANTKLNRILTSEPIITEESPATLKVLEKGEYNGYVTAVVDLAVTSFVQNEELFDVAFA
jgi:hypothetical protein